MQEKRARGDRRFTVSHATVGVGLRVGGNGTGEMPDPSRDRSSKNGTPDEMSVARGFVAPASCR